MEYLTFTAHKGMSVDMSIAYMDAGKEKYKTVSEQVDATAGMLAVSFHLIRLYAGPVLPYHPSHIMMSY